MVWFRQIHCTGHKEGLVQTDSLYWSQGGFGLDRFTVLVTRRFGLDRFTVLVSRRFGLDRFTVLVTRRFGLDRFTVLVTRMVWFRQIHCTGHKEGLV